MESSPSASQEHPIESEKVVEQEKRSSVLLKTVQCPYNTEHQVPLQNFNEHVWQCRFERMSFYPHALELKRCKYDIRHFLPKEELEFHELYCRQEAEETLKLLKTEPIELDVGRFLALQKERNRLEGQWDDDDSNSDSDDDDGDRKKKKKEKEVTSEIEDSDLDEEDRDETIKRLVYLDLIKKINNAEMK
ncbi:unnamed protein product [Caenorhabditis sp. 36 PRJEB53466]|nr:unnamed protein product [Caenorhabditis sp. 36 PRJEB53466]